MLNKHSEARITAFQQRGENPGKRGGLFSVYSRNADRNLAIGADTGSNVIVGKYGNNGPAIGQNHGEKPVRRHYGPDFPGIFRKIQPKEIISEIENGQIKGHISVRDGLPWSCSVKKMIHSLSS